MIFGRNHCLFCKRHSRRESQGEKAMGKLKLQVQITVDGFVAGPEGQLDWMTFDTSLFLR